MPQQASANPLQVPASNPATETQRERSGGNILIDALRLHGTDRVFLVPGESYLDAMDALQDASEIQVIVGRHEGAVANMAEADGKLTGRPGIAFVTRGPGATHASIGVHTAMQDSTPMILFIGQVDVRFRGREAFQEVEYRDMFAPLAKWVAEIDDVKRIPEFVARAFQVATSGRPGPVVLALPSDMLESKATVADTPPFRAVSASPAQADVDALHQMLQEAQRPMVVLGGSEWTQAGCDDIATFIRANALPVSASFRRQHLFDNDDPHYVGHVSLGINPKLAQRLRDTDLLIVLGSRLSEVPSQGYTLFESPTPTQRMVHVHVDPNELGRVYNAALPINASMPAMAAALRALVPVHQPRWAAWTAAARADHVAFSTPPTLAPDYRGVDMSAVMQWLETKLAPDAFISNGAGNYTIWVHRFHRYRQFRTQLAPTSGAMGYGLPAAIAAKLRHPDREVICFAGDGCFLMYPQELSTAVQYGAAVITIVVNNGIYGTIRMHQEKTYPGRTANTSIVNPDFAALARAFGAHGELVEKTEDFPAAFERARASGKPALIEVRIDPRQITPAMRSAQG
ncbi:MAG: ilvG 2 [Herminiimonas sp.]|nr:ilvG 2 [Herminiimonas sp.]